MKNIVRITIAYPDATLLLIILYALQWYYLLYYSWGYRLAHIYEDDDPLL